MARRGRIYFQNAVYHITIRGNNRQGILEDSEDKIELLECVEKFKCRFGFKVYGLVIMDNHAHFVIETNHKANISKVMQAITLSYSVKFRKKYPYTGHVWQGRFNSNVIRDDRYILECLEYIHRNPIRAGMVEKIEDYIWSSYHLYHDYRSRIREYIQIDKFEI